MSRIRFLLCLACVASAPAAAQESRSTTSMFNFEGKRIDWSSSQAGDSSSKVTIASLNGTRVPVEQTEEKVLLKEPGKTVVERVIRRYSSDGRPLPPEKTRIESTTSEDGKSTQIVTVFRGDLNGALTAAERSVTHSITSGGQVKSETAVERASINGSFATIERRAATTVAGENRSETNTVIYLPDANGTMVAAAQQIVRSAVKDGVATEQSDEYENVSTGKLQLSKQSVARTLKNPDGSERREVDVFGNAATGRAVSNDGTLSLRERQIYSRRPENGKVVEQFSVQRPSLDDSRRLLAPQLVSETVCQGKCK